MIAHLALFAPKASLTETARATLLDALEGALRNIPGIVRAHIGRRLRLGRLYDELNAMDFPFIALLEFDNEAALRTYLDHPAHATLGEQFYATSESSLALDFEMVEADRMRELAGLKPRPTYEAGT